MKDNCIKERKEQKERKKKDMKDKFFIGKKKERRHEI